VRVLLDLRGVMWVFAVEATVLQGVKYPEHVYIPNLFLVGKSYSLVVQRPPFLVSSPEHLCNLSASLAALPIDEPKGGKTQVSMKPFSRFILLDTPR
jgi:hypothetical protein